MEKIIENKSFGQERALYGIKNTTLNNCKFEGKEDGESAIKESDSITCNHCLFTLRYPLWHCNNLVVVDSEMTETCRASLWYCDGVNIENSTLRGIKALRESKNISIKETKINSEELLWRCEDIKIFNTKIESTYFMFESLNALLEHVFMKGKYSFQYCENLVFDNCELDTKDALWHSKNCVIKNSVVKGEYLAWYSENLTLINCKIIGLQPLCYCKNLRLINCIMDNCNLSFEYSEVKADVKGKILSVKNPLKGKIVADEYGEILFTDDAKFKCKCKVKTR